MFKISQFIKDPIIKAAFERVERDNPQAPMQTQRPAPKLSGGDAARVLEIA
ncbi:hypothetical protein [Bradyrhizobium sp. SK17]|uniref:hypothetical protein n=1 Tax=Bradyrhizobium sp. SK17 TaxID=2057741 RepID=UPI00143DEFD9|nr:hypothetical protein [Bradyrhizobium sp. SK17]